MSILPNITRTIITGISLLLSVSVSSSFAQTALPDLGTAAANTFSIDKEIAYGDAYMRVIRASAPMLQDPVLSQYLTELGNKLVANATGVKTSFKFFLINNDEINAFAFFGGHVGVHSGLFLNAANESELASVLSHEIAHVTQRHLARTIEAQQKSRPATIAGLLGAILLTVAAPQAGMAALATTQAMSAQSQINYTRQNEQEADRIGMKTLVSAGFDPNGAADFFSVLAKRYRFTTMPPQMLLTHPLPEHRITDARNRAAQYPATKIADSLDFQLAKARIQVRFSNYSDEKALEIFNNQLTKKNYRLKEAALYGKALALFRLKQFPESEQIIDELRQSDPYNLFYLDTKTDLLTQNKQYDQAISLLKKHHQLKPSSQVITLNLANVYIEAKQPKKAIPLLENTLYAGHQDPLPHILLKQAYQHTSNTAMEHYSQAEIMALQANYKDAIKQLKLAYKNSNGKQLQLARIEAKLRQFKLAEKSMEEFK